MIEKVKQVLLTRDNFKNSPLSDLYSPIRMPPQLTKAHKELDFAIDLCYRKQQFISEKDRMEFLIELYQEYIKTLF